MFTLDSTIDAVQNSKKQFVNTFITNKAIADAMINLVDVETEYTKRAAKVGMDTATTLTSEAMKTAQEAMKFDYTKVGENFTKAYSTMQKSAAKASK